MPVHALYLLERWLEENDGLAKRVVTLRGFDPDRSHAGEVISVRCDHVDKLASARFVAVFGGGNDAPTVEITNGRVQVPDSLKAGVYNVYITGRSGEEAPPLIFVVEPSATCSRRTGH